MSASAPDEGKLEASGAVGSPERSSATQISLVVATKGRSEALALLLESLARQTDRDFDVTIVDQNLDERVAPVLERGWPFPLRQLRTPGASGACRARNHGWRTAPGRFVLFPDDDCWYPEDFLARARGLLEETQADILTGRAADESGRSINGRFETRAEVVRAANVWTTSIEWVAFFRRELLDRLKGFDENIGIGAASPWQSCESQDIVLRALALGARVAYDPGLFGHHAELDTRNPDAAMIAKGRAYARGMGFVLRKHRVGWPRRLYWAVRPGLNAALSFALGRGAAARYHAGVSLGRLEGARARLFTSGRG